MNNGWIKHFNDGRTEFGFDDEVAAHKASWRNGRQEGLCAVELRYDDTCMVLNGTEGEWWQSDTPPIPRHDIGSDLSVVNTWLRQGFRREDLLGALGMYQGPPVTLLVTHKRGNRNLISRLMGEWRKRQDLQGCKVGAVLRQMAQEEGTL